MRRIHSYLLVTAIVVVVVLLGAGVVVWKLMGTRGGYTAVYLKTGEIYFGKLSYFPYGLAHPYLLQINKDNAQAPFSLQNFKNAIWGPEDFLSLNRESVVWTAKLNPEGTLGRALASDPDFLPQPAPQPAPTSSEPKR